MSEQEHMPNAPRQHARRRVRSRLRRFFLRHLPLSIAALTVLLLLATVGAYFFASSATFQNFVRLRLIADLQAATGGRAEIATFHWDLLAREADADGVVIHGLEGPGEAPYARIEHLQVRLSILGMISPRIHLRSLEIRRPALHLIVYPGGSTNQPHPRRPAKPGKPGLDSLFSLKAGSVVVEQGVLDYDNRASSFDFQDRHEPLDFAAKDVSVRMRYVPATAHSPVAYHIEAGATDLNLARSGRHNASPPVHGKFLAALDLTRGAVILRSLSLSAQSRGTTARVLSITGSLEDFTHPHWQARILGDLDMRLLDPITGYPYAPEGLAHLDLTAAGQAGLFRVDGSVHVQDGAYVGTGVVARGIGLDASIHADPERLLITQIVARFRQGGRMEGTVDLAPWLPRVAGQATLEPISALRTGAHTRRQIIAPSGTIPVNGKVAAEFHDVALDTLLDIVSEPPFQRLGLDARLNGSALATWVKGDSNTVTVSSTLNLTPSASTPSGEVPTSGIIDATYTQRDGAVAVRELALHLPSSSIVGHGQLGAYPLVSPTALSVEFHSRKLAEFDTVLRDLGLRENGKVGAAALPLTLQGEADFQGTWNGSLVRPRLAGNLQATQLDIDMPVRNGGRVQRVHLDAVQATGSYAAARIAIEHALLQHGATTLAISGELNAVNVPGSKEPAYNTGSTLHMHLHARNLAVADVQPFVERKLPVSGTLQAQLQADGPLHDPATSGWIQLDNGTVGDEPVKHLHAEGSFASQKVKLSTYTLSAAGGTVSGSGSYDFASQQFQAAARGTGLDIARIAWLDARIPTAVGKLAFQITASGTAENPNIQGSASLTALTLGGQHMGAVEAVARTTGNALHYNLTTHVEGAALSLHGQTGFGTGYPTQAEVAFSQFNIGSLLKMAGMQAFTGESALAGTITLNGPLAHPEQLSGEARLRQLAVTLEGVHLDSSGGMHATLANGRIHLDPLHITGENTDLHAEGSLALKGTRQLDLAASGSINLKLAETLDPDLTASGLTTFQVEAHGPLSNPGLRGRIDFQNGSLSLEDLPNGLSQLHGTLIFNQNRLEVSSLTAMSGGGLLSVGGSLSYQHGIYANLTVTGKGIRIRYPEGVSSLADAQLRLEGTRTSMLLSGGVLITRFTASPSLDIAALAAQANSVPTITPPDAPSNHIRLDVRVVSSPQLNFQNAFAKLAGDVDLRLRGTLAAPSLLGRVSITDGNAMIAGTRYDLQRGEISFTNPIRIEPEIDLNATARVQDYDITLGLHGTLDKLAVNYRSDPPLPEADVLALLALGHTASQERLYTQQQEQELANPSTNALLGGALNATVSSRVQKLFGAGSVKVDPNYLGAFGNSTSRITVQEQLGRNVTLTYATDVNTTGQQLLQAEVAINRHVSLVVARDESGVFSVVIKATRRYR